MHCAVCSCQVHRKGSRAYVLGRIRGRVCLGCQEGLAVAVGRWVDERREEVTERHRERFRARAGSAEAEQVPRGLRVVSGGGR